MSQVYLRDADLVGFEGALVLRVGGDFPHERFEGIFLTELLA